MIDLKYESVSDVAYSRLKVWPLSGKAYWICGVTIPDWREKSLTVTIAGPEGKCYVQVPFMRSRWKRWKLTLTKKNDIRLFPFGPMWALTPVMIKAEAEKGKAVKVGLIVAKDAREI